LSHKYLDFIREQNKAIASKCHICKKQSTGINAYKHEIKFVCEDHLRREPRVILDTSMPNILHYTYPDGKDVPEHMMNPNIGGFRGTSKKDNQE
jgi:hypothetical protein